MFDYEQLFQHQINAWPLAATNYQALAQITSRTFRLDDILIRVHYNPGRMASSSANLSATVIQQRPCFLCAQNRPVEQESLTVPGDTRFQLLVNPFPVFPRHYTIAADHQPQSIVGNIGTFLHLVRIMNDCVVFYNGPRCGASAPDHLHFQAGNKGFIPVETDFPNWKTNHTNLLIRQKEAQVSQLNSFIRGGWLLEGTDETLLTTWLNDLLEAMQSAQTIPEEEPMINLLSWFDNGSWVILIFPRKAHRPACYTYPEDKKRLISPASVEMGGLIVAARSDDFERITETDLRTIYTEVSLSDADVALRSALFVVKQNLYPKKNR